jgi:hypothetical protein
MMDFSTNRLPVTQLATSLIVAAMLSVWLPRNAIGQSTTLAKRAVTGPTTVTTDRRPDFGGIWDFSALTPLERPKDLAGKEFFTPQEAAEWARQTLERESLDNRDGGAQANVNRGYNEYWLERGVTIRTLRTSLIIDPSEGRLPVESEEGRRRIAATMARITGHELDGPETRQLPDRCVKLQGGGPPITPTIYNNFVRIVQNRANIVILHEMGHEARVIPLDGRPHAPEQLRSWDGDSRAHWEGDTLVVETTNFRDRSLYPATETASDATYKMTEKMRLTERFRRIDEDTLQYQFTVDDPGMWSRPWTAEIPARKSAGPLLEYACQEGNEAGMISILSGARLAEKKAQEKRSN